MTTPRLGDLALRAGLLDTLKLADVLRFQQQKGQQGDFRRLGELLVEMKVCGPDAVRRLLAEQGIVIVVCELCGTRYNGIHFRGQKPCLRCGQSLRPTGEADPLSVEDSITDPGPEGEALLRASFERSLRMGDYVILGEVGRGGMGVIYKAWEPAQQRYAALKFVNKPQELSYEDESRFQREAQAIVRLQHPNIIRGFTSGTVGGLLYMAMEFLPGVTLDVLTRSGSLVEHRLVDACRAIADALQHAHGLGMIHRDVKPQNIVIDIQGRPCLVDFGIVKASDESVSLTMVGEVVGSVAYMAPEYLSGGVEALDPRADVYGLGIVLYEGLSGRFPYDEPDAFDFCTRLLTCDPLPLRKANPAVPASLAAAVDKAIAKDPNGRHASAAELSASLRAFVASGAAFGEAPKGMFGKLKKLMGD